MRAVRRLQGKEHVRSQVHGRRAQHVPDRCRRRAAARVAQGESARPRRRSARRSARRSDVHATRGDTHAKGETRTRARDFARPPAAAHLRARHQRADARPDGDLPLRRARRLHPDDRAGGARRGKERPVGSGAQRAPGEPLPRRADGERHQDADRSRARAADGEVHERRQEAGRPAGCSSRPRC